MTTNDPNRTLIMIIGAKMFGLSVEDIEAIDNELASLSKENKTIGEATSYLCTKYDPKAMIMGALTISNIIHKEQRLVELIKQLKRYTEEDA